MVPLRTDTRCTAASAWSIPDPDGPASTPPSAVQQAKERLAAQVSQCTPSSPASMSKEAKDIEVGWEVTHNEVADVVSQAEAAIMDTLITEVAEVVVGWKQRRSA